MSKFRVTRAKLFKLIVFFVLLGYLISIALVSQISYQNEYHYNQKNCTTYHELNFSETLKAFSWNLLNDSIAETNPSEVYKLIAKLIKTLIPFITMEPRIPIQETCQPPTMTEVKCSKLLEKPRKVAVILQFGFDVDNLEIHLNELYDIVDRFFILESYRTHFASLEKPLVWEIVKGQDRFNKFLNKVTHFILDDSEMVNLVEGIQGNINKTFDWKMEALHEKIRWEKFLMWNNQTGYFQDDDLVGFGDTDEIPSRNAINHLKTCEFNLDPVDIGIWFPFGNIKQAIKTDFPVSKKHGFTLGDPTYWKLKTAKLQQTRKTSINSFKTLSYPTRMRGASPNFILGGMHMSHYGYLPYQILKRITQTELDISDLQEISGFVKDCIENRMKWTEFERSFAAVPNSLKFKVFDLIQLKKATDIDKIVVLPWFYDCNRQRYPAWEGGHDSRID